MSAQLAVRAWTGEIELILGDQLGAIPEDRRKRLANLCVGETQNLTYAETLRWLRGALTEELAKQHYTVVLPPDQLIAHLIGMATLNFPGVDGLQAKLRWARIDYTPEMLERIKRVLSDVSIRTLLVSDADRARLVGDTRRKLQEIIYQNGVPK